MDDNYSFPNTPPAPMGGPIYTPPVFDPNKEVMSLKDWIITLLICAIPCVGFIMMLVWAFSEGNENRKNYCRASLIFSLIMMVLSILFSMVFATAIAGIMGSMGSSMYF